MNQNWYFLILGSYLVNDRGVCNSGPITIYSVALCIPLHKVTVQQNKDYFRDW